MIQDRYSTDPSEYQFIIPSNVDRNSGHSIARDSGYSSVRDSNISDFSITGMMEYDINYFSASLAIKRPTDSQGSEDIATINEEMIKHMTMNTEAVDSRKQQTNSLTDEKNTIRTTSTYDVDPQLEADKDRNRTPGHHHADTDSHIIKGYSIKPDIFSSQHGCNLKESCVVTVNLPAHIATGQMGKGAILKFHFSPYTKIEYLRIAILKVSLHVDFVVVVVVDDDDDVDDVVALFS